MINYDALEKDSHPNQSKGQQTKERTLIILKTKITEGSEMNFNTIFSEESEEYIYISTPPINACFVPVRAL